MRRWKNRIGARRKFDRVCRLVVGGCCCEGTEQWPNEQSAPNGAPTPGGEEKGALGGAPSGAAPAADPDTVGSATPRGPPENVAYVRPRYFRWAELLGRVFEVEILACPDCGGRLSLVATIEQRGVIEKILAHLGLPTELPTPVLSAVEGPAPARSPAWLPGYSD